MGGERKDILRSRKGYIEGSEKRREEKGRTGRGVEKEYIEGSEEEESCCKKIHSL